VAVALGLTVGVATGVAVALGVGVDRTSGVASVPLLGPGALVAGGADVGATVRPQAATVKSASTATAQRAGAHRIMGKTLRGARSSVCLMLSVLRQGVAVEA
jgi:hypothetical protein